jgi:hypothetical protein
MPRSLDEGFRDFLSSLTPSAVESERAKSHRSSIDACLVNNFNRKTFFRTGSFGNGRSVYGHSDVDYFAEIPTDKLKQNSGATLSNLREVLHNRFPTSGAYVDCPAVVVPFGLAKSETTEIVPTDYIKQTREGFRVYEIPDCSGGWMQASLEAHNAYVRAVDKKLNGKVKPLIRFIKAWKYYRQVPISSFYIELRVAKYAQDESQIFYDIDIKRIFALLSNLNLAAIQDPMGISGYIPACSSDAKKEDALSKLQTALTRAEKALEVKAKGDIGAVFLWWNLIFDSKFPNYYY